MSHYVRVVGASLNGEVTESAETTADKCKMSVGKVSQCRKALEVEGWIKIKREKRYLEITVKDFWLKNFLAYATQTEIDAQAEILNQLGYYKIPTSQRPEKAKSPNRPKKSADKKARTAQADPRHHPLMKAYFARLGYTPSAPATEGRSAKNLLKQYPDLNIEQIMSCYDWLKKDNFWKTKPVTLATVHKNLGEWLQQQAPVAQQTEDLSEWES